MATRIYPISDWTAYPSGGAITITGTDAGGTLGEVRLQRVARIETSRGLFRTYRYALDRQGRRLARLL